MNEKEYSDFLRAKVKLANRDGFEVELSEINPRMKLHNRLMVQYMVRGGRRACFAAFGLHKTVTQLEALRVIIKKILVESGTNPDNLGLEDYRPKALIICPLSVRAEFIKDAVEILGWTSPPKFVRSISEIDDRSVFLTNYETVRDGKLDPRLFDVVSLDEASVLRGFGGSKTFREFMKLFTGDEGPKGNRDTGLSVPYRFVATATPSPNEYIELLAYADFLGIMDVSQAKTRFFKRNSTKADQLTLHPHKEEEFWLWMASWALFVQKPSDITGDEKDDEGYILPELDLRWHEIETDRTQITIDKHGRYSAFDDDAIGLEGAAKVKRETLDLRVAKMMELRAEDPEAHRMIWHDLEDERRAIEKAIPTAKTVFGSQKIEVKEEIVAQFSRGEIAEMAGKPIQLGSGCNLQRHCHWAIYLGIGFKFNDFIQSIHRLLRFLQEHQVRVDLIYTDKERRVRQTLERKWEQHKILVKNMTEIIKKYGLSHAEMAQHLSRAIGVEPITVKGDSFEVHHNDNVLQASKEPDNSVGLILTSWPFTNQYEYSPNYADFGHSDNPQHFFKQMDFLTPEEYRILQPGRLYALHVKDRIIPGGFSGLGFQTTYPFHVDCIQHMTRHGFAYMGMKTIVTDVVRENNQTYRLGWTEQCKDGSKMGFGMPEYLLLFRKPPSENSNAYADVPVIKEKKMWDESEWVNPEGYSRARWQTDAHGHARSNGDRLLSTEELSKMTHRQIYQTFKRWTESEVYNYEHHVQIAERLEIMGKLPSGFMLLQPASWQPDVWTDIVRMRTLNGSQWSMSKEMHVCPMQFDIADRVIRQMSNPGDVVWDSFGGLLTTVDRAIRLGRFGKACELSPSYFWDGVAYCKSAENQVKTPSLLDLMEDWGMAEMEADHV